MLDFTAMMDLIKAGAALFGIASLLNRLARRQGL